MADNKNKLDPDDQLAIMADYLSRFLHAVPIEERATIAKYIIIQALLYGANPESKYEAFGILHDAALEFETLYTLTKRKQDIVNKSLNLKSKK